MNKKKIYEEDLHSTKKERTKELACGLNKCITPFFTVVSMEMLVCSIDIFLKYIYSWDKKECILFMRLAISISI